MPSAATTNAHSRWFADRRRSSYDRQNGSLATSCVRNDAARDAIAPSCERLHEAAATLRRNGIIQRLINVVMFFAISRAILMLRCAAAVGELNQWRIYLELEKGRAHPSLL